jgi:hypothetical protein
MPFLPSQMLVRSRTVFLIVFQWGPSNCARLWRAAQQVTGNRRRSSSYDSHRPLAIVKKKTVPHAKRRGRYGMLPIMRTLVP